ncbi:hypothetical protein QTO30_00065 [Yoonia sp. GPGPB17]|uniref:hypothetical protein n=1 Tax=Yoonia sp. GPGPB17 TaxID=3026147 RepID=UPI0030C392E4
MMRFRPQTIVTALLLGLIAQQSLAENDIIPSLEHDHDVCPDHPPEPEWMQQIPLREAYQRVLVQDIYRAQNMERIVATGKCDCAIRFPAWDEALATFHDNYEDAERWGMLEASDTYNRRANDLRPEAKAICETAGNW